MSFKRISFFDLLERNIARAVEAAYASKNPRTAEEIVKERESRGERPSILQKSAEATEAANNDVHGGGL